MKNQQETKTYGELKYRKAEIRNEMDAGNFQSTEEYSEVVAAIKRAESWLLWTIVCLIIFVGGCGKMMRGTGLIFEGLGDGVVAGGQHLQDSTSQEK